MLNGTIQTGRRSRAVLIAAVSGCLALVAMLSGCASIPALGGADLLPLLGNGAGVYVVVPVKANRLLAETLLSASAGTGSSPASLDRIDTLCAGIFPDGSVRAAISGNIPKSAASLAFKKADGWIRHSDAARGAWYTRERRGAAIPRGGILLYAEGEGSIESMLDASASPAPVATSSAFDAWLSSPESSTSVGIYVADFASVAGGFLGPELELPVDHAEVFLKAAATQTDAAANAADYSVSAHFAVTDARAARAVVAMLRLAAIPSGSVPDIRGDGPDVYVSGLSMSGESLAGMASFLYLGNNISK